MTNPAQIERFTRADMDAMQMEAEAPSLFFTNLFFPTEVYSTSQFVEWDLVRKGRRMAPFVAPTVRGRPMTRDGHITKALRPAYVKQTSTVDLTRPLSRLPGEEWGGSLSPMERFNRLMAEDMLAHSEHLKNRLEWMAVQTMLYGGYTIVGEEYPETAIDFMWSPNLDVALAGAATWDQVTSSPLRDIEQMALEIRTESYGAVARDIIMDPLAWSLFKEHADVKELLDLDVGRRTDLPGTSFDMGIRNNMYANGTGAELVGRVAGRFNIWVYEAYYEDNNGDRQAYMPDYTVLVTSPAEVEGRQYFGMILDMEASYEAVKQFFKSKSQWDPSGEEVLSQSAPLVAPRRTNTWGKLTVA